MSIFDSAGSFEQTITIRSGIDCLPNVVEVEAGAKSLGRIVEVDCGDHGGELGDFGYIAYLARRDGAIFSTPCSGLASFEGALAAIIANSEIA